jgi:hypothetical protein
MNQYAEIGIAIFIGLLIILLINRGCKCNTINRFSVGIPPPVLQQPKRSAAATTGRWQSSTISWSKMKFNKAKFAQIHNGTSHRSFLNGIALGDIFTIYLAMEDAEREIIQANYADLINFNITKLLNRKEEKAGYDKYKILMEQSNGIQEDYPLNAHKYIDRMYEDGICSLALFPDNTNVSRLMLTSPYKNFMLLAGVTKKFGPISGPGGMTCPEDCYPLFYSLLLDRSKQELNAIGMFDMGDTRSISSGQGQGLSWEDTGFDTLTGEIRNNYYNMPMVSWNDPVTKWKPIPLIKYFSITTTSNNVISHLPAIRPAGGAQKYNDGTKIEMSRKGQSGIQTRMTLTDIRKNAISSDIKLVTMSSPYSKSIGYEMPIPSFLKEEYTEQDQRGPNTNRGITETVIGIQGVDLLDGGYIGFQLSTSTGKGKDFNLTDMFEIHHNFLKAMDEVKYPKTCVSSDGAKPDVILYCNGKCPPPPPPLADPKFICDPSIGRDKKYVGSCRPASSKENNDFKNNNVIKDHANNPYNSDFITDTIVDCEQWWRQHGGCTNARSPDAEPNQCTDASMCPGDESYCALVDGGRACIDWKDTDPMYACIGRNDLPAPPGKRDPTAKCTYIPPNRRRLIGTAKANISIDRVFRAGYGLCGSQKTRDGQPNPCRSQRSSGVPPIKEDP